MLEADYMVGKQFLQDLIIITHSASILARNIEKKRADGSWNKKSECERLSMLAELFVLSYAEQRIQETLDTFDECDSLLLESLILDDEEDIAEIPEESKNETNNALFRFTQRLFETK